MCSVMWLRTNRRSQGILACHVLININFFFFFGWERRLQFISISFKTSATWAYNIVCPWRFWAVPGETHLEFQNSRTLGRPDAGTRGRRDDVQLRNMTGNHKRNVYCGQNKSPPSNTPSGILLAFPAMRAFRTAAKTRGRV